MTRVATQLVMTYDDEGNASFKSVDITNTRNSNTPKEFIIGEVVNRFQFNTSPTVIDELVPDPLTSQLIEIRKYITGESSDNEDTSMNLVKPIEFNQFDIGDSMTKHISNALGDAKGKKFSRYSTIADTTDLFKGIDKTLSTAEKVGIGSIVIDPITSLFATGLNKYSERQRENIIKEYHDSNYYADKMNRMQTEYETYGDYDAYTDYSAGPTYTREDLKPGTVFDADTDPADEGVQPTTTTGIMSRDQGVQVGDNYQDSSDSSSQEDTSPGSTGPGGSDVMGSF